MATLVNPAKKDVLRAELAQAPLCEEMEEIQKQHRLAKAVKA